MREAYKRQQGRKDMRAVLIGLGAALMLAGPALADDSVLASRFGNTTITKDASGNETRLYYSADHTVKVKAGGKETNGTWKIDGGTICLTYANPAALPAGTPNPTCVPVSEHKVGETWSAGPYTVTLVAGIQ
jgi:hypothetical protein